jgi:hypothetical protein
MITLFSVIGLTLIPLFNAASRGYTPVDVRTILAADAQTASRRLQTRLATLRRLFVRDPAGDAFAVCIAAPAAPLLPGSRFPAPAAADTPLPPSPGDAGVGNELLFLSVDRTERPPNLLDGQGAPSDVAVDVLVFVRFYLSPREGTSLGGQATRDLWEWHSGPYADYAGLIGLPDATLRNAAISALVAKGVTQAFDLTAPAPVGAFYRLSDAPPWIAPLPSPLVEEGGATPLTGPRGGESRSFIYGVSPNTSANFAPAHDVPAYARADGDFPSGFEVAVAGPPEARKVFVRLVMAAKGDFKGVGSYEKTFTLPVKEK